MKLKLKHIAAATALLASAYANATILPSVTAGTGGELFLAVFQEGTAGFADQSYTFDIGITTQQFLAANNSSAMWATREVSRHLIARRSGGIVIIGSTARFNPAYTETAYRISKMGLRMLMQNLAIELAPYGVRVNMVTPGHFVTRMTGGISAEIEAKMLDIIPAHRFGEPGEIGNAVAFLLSDRLSRYTIGADLVIDGGLTLNPLPLRSPEEIEQLNL